MSREKLFTQIFAEMLEKFPGLRPENRLALDVDADELAEWLQDEIEGLPAGSINPPRDYRP